MKECEIHIRVSKKEKDLIVKKANKSKMNISEFLIESANQVNINVFDKNNKIETELRRIGNNINQLTKLANSGIIKCVDLSNVKGELKDIWQLLNSLTIR